MFFLLFSVPRLLQHFIDLVTTLGIHFQAFLASFWRSFSDADFRLNLYRYLEAFWHVFFVYFLILFLHSLENVDFIKIAVFLQENKVFHGSEGSKITDFFRQGFWDRFFIDLRSHLGSFFDLLASLFDTFRASFFFLLKLSFCF